MKRHIIFVFIIATLVLGFFWRHYNPSHRERIYRNLKVMTMMASYQAPYTKLQKVHQARKLTEFFTEDFIISYQAGEVEHLVDSKQQLIQEALVAESFAKKVTVDFQNFRVDIQGDHAFVFIDLIGRGVRSDNGKEFFEGIHLKLSLRFIDGKWLIAAVNNNTLEEEASSSW